MEKFDYKSKKRNFTECEIDSFFFSKGWNGLLLVLLVVIVVTLPIFQAAAYDSHNESC